jgi:hypothetical protein
VLSGEKLGLTLEKKRSLRGEIEPVTSRKMREAKDALECRNNRGSRREKRLQACAALASVRVSMAQGEGEGEGEGVVHGHESADEVLYMYACRGLCM